METEIRRRVAQLREEAFSLTDLLLREGAIDAATLLQTVGNLLGKVEWRPPGLEGQPHQRGAQLERTRSSADTGHGI
jgi:hypothetical protein